ncbi:hypothetical protein, partial [Pseudomonas aeruginosa]|uniref:hypothetical protein n=1 Tax=Pseudomonas aeruginosa TaxID=287 RepID=UPI001968DB10
INKSIKRLYNKYKKRDERELGNKEKEPPIHVQTKLTRTQVKLLDKTAKDLGKDRSETINELLRNQHGIASLAQKKARKSVDTNTKKFSTVI